MGNARWQGTTRRSDWQGSFAEPSLSPDGRRLSVSLLPDASYDGIAQVSDIWIKRLDRGPSVKLTLEERRTNTVRGLRTANP